MNYVTLRADRLRVGMICYRTPQDTVITAIYKAGDLHLLIVCIGGIGTRHIPRNAPVLVQACHRRHYEASVHHRPINQEERRARLSRRFIL